MVLLYASVRFYRPDRQLLLDSHVHPKERRHAHSLWCAGEWRICAKTSNHVMGVVPYLVRCVAFWLYHLLGCTYKTLKQSCIDVSVGPSAAYNCVLCRLTHVPVPVSTVPYRYRYLPIIRYLSTPITSAPCSAHFLHSPSCTTNSARTCAIWGAHAKGEKASVGMVEQTPGKVTSLPNPIVL